MVASKRFSTVRTTSTGRIVYRRAIHYFSRQDVRRIMSAWANLDTDPIYGFLMIWTMVLELGVEVLKTNNELRAISRWAQVFQLFAATLMRVSIDFALEPLLFLWRVIRDAIGYEPTPEPTPEPPAPPI